MDRHEREIPAVDALNGDCRSETNPWDTFSGEI